MVEKNVARTKKEPNTCLAWFLWGLDFLFWLVTLNGPIKCLHRYLQSVEISTVQKGNARRHPDAMEKLTTTPVDDVDTVTELIERAFVDYKTRVLFGTRKFLRNDKERRVFGKTEWKTYGEVHENVKLFGRALLNLGIKQLPKNRSIEDEILDKKPVSCLMLYEDTSEEWTTACIGALRESICVATSYATLGMAALSDACAETRTDVILCNYQKVDELISAKERLPYLKTIIYTCLNFSPSDVDLEKVKSTPKLRIISYDDFLAEGKIVKNDHTPPSPENTAIIMYTSGSTGKPKGVEMLHRQILAGIGGVHYFIDDCTIFMGNSLDHTYLSYLPTAHILEFMLQLACITRGIRIGIADPKTLTSRGAVRETPEGVLNETPGWPYPPGAIQEFRPTLIAGVPKIFDIFKKAIQHEIQKQPSWKRWIFEIAYKGKLRALREGRSTPFFNLLIFNKISAMFGGKLRAIICGGSALPPDLQTFLRIVFGAEVLQGFGATEINLACCQKPQTNETKTIGGPMVSTEFRLRSVNEPTDEDVRDGRGLPYLETDTFHLSQPCLGRGELLFSGPSVAKGYFMEKEKTKESFRKIGDKVWYHTGDVGVLHLNGNLEILDRVKNLVKLKGGEYVALEHMESVYSQSVFVNSMAGGIVCYASSELDRPIAFVQVNRDEILQLAKREQISGDIEKLCKNETINKLVLQNLLQQADSGNLGSNERINKILILPNLDLVGNELNWRTSWTPENGGLTATNKVNRRSILAQLRQEI